MSGQSQRNQIWLATAFSRKFREIAALGLRRLLRSDASDGRFETRRPSTPCRSRASASSGGSSSSGPTRSARASRSRSARDDRCETAAFFPNLRLSYAENLLGRARRRGRRAGRAWSPATATAPASELTPPRAARAGPPAGRAPARPRDRQGDRVVAIAANTPEAIVGALAAATLGATFSSAAPEMGAAAILSRFEQLSPKLLLAGARHEELAEVVASLPSLRAVDRARRRPAPAASSVPMHRLSELLASPPPEPLAEGWERFPFNHPLFILFTSGTTGAAEVHRPRRRRHAARAPQGAPPARRPRPRGHPLLPDQRRLDDVELAALGARLRRPDRRLRRPARRPRRRSGRSSPRRSVTVFGTSPPYLQLCQDSGYSPRRAATRRGRCARSSRPARSCATGSTTGSPRRSGPVKLQSISGGTDIVGCFVLGHPELPVRRGMIQCRSLGLDVQALATRVDALRLGDRRAGLPQPVPLAAAGPPRRRGRQPLPRRLLRRRTRASGPTAT